jgi:hypothetical protein
VPLNTYTNWVRGIREPSSEWIVAISTRLGVSADWLLGIADAASAQAERVPAAAPGQVSESVTYDRPPAGESYWRNLVASQQATIATLTNLLSDGKTSAASKASSRAAAKNA